MKCIEHDNEDERKAKESSLNQIRLQLTLFPVLHDNDATKKRQQLPFTLSTIIKN